MSNVTSGQGWQTDLHHHQDEGPRSARNETQAHVENLKTSSQALRESEGITFQIMHSLTSNNLHDYTNLFAAFFRQNKCCLI